MDFRIKSLVLLSAVNILQIAHAANNEFAYPPYHINPNSNFVSPVGLTPSKVRAYYGFSSFPLQGAGQTIGIVDAFDHPNIEADLTIFNDTFDLLPCTRGNGCFKKIYARDTQPSVNAQWSVETSLDVEWAHAMAPRAKILLVEAQDNSLAELAQAARVAVKNGATVVSMSWGAPEFPSEVEYDRTFNVPGVTFTAASGDWGNGTLYPAASPYVLSVGGSSIILDDADNYVEERAWSGSGGGLSVYENVLENQTNLPIPNDFTDTRGIPDVAYHANPDMGYAVYNSVPVNNKHGWYIVGGTSAGAPQWAAIVALANQFVSPIEGSNLNINTVLYRIGAAASYNANFNDVISGRNGPCGYFCQAHIGYDYVTGLGTPKLPTLLNTVYQYYLTAGMKKKSR